MLIYFRSVLIRSTKPNKIVNKYKKDYLWHKDYFKLSPRTNLSNFLTTIEGKEG